MSVDPNMESSLAARWMITVADRNISGVMDLLLVKNGPGKELPYCASDRLFLRIVYFVFGISSLTISWH